MYIKFFSTKGHNANKNDKISPHKFNVVSEEKIQLFWWFLIISALTIFFKFNYFNMIYRGGFSVAIENYLENDTWIEYIKVASLMFVKNIGEVAFFLLLLYVFFCKFMRINQKIIIVSSILFVFFAGAANHLSLINVRSLLTYDSLLITIDWMSNNPDVIRSYITRKNLIYIILFIILSFLPIIFSNPRLRSTSFLWLNRILISITVLLVVVSLPLYSSMDIFLKNNANLKPFNGYWTSLASSFAGFNNASLQNREVPTLEEMRSNYTNLAYPEQNEAEKQRTPYIMPLKADKKHIIIIGLETAPQKYYPIVNNPKLKNFYKMSKSSIVSDMHFTSSPYTFYAYYSILSGTYVPTAGTGIVYGKMSFNGLANVLPKYGYIPTFIDSYYTDWHEGDAHERVINRFGFERIFDRGDYDFKKETANFSSDFDKDYYSETISFNKIIESIDDAEENNKKSLIFVSTLLGHYKWKAKNGDENLSNKEKVFGLVKALDELMGNLLASIKERNLENDVIIVVTGDHGLRYHDEYKSLNEEDSNIAVGFNVAMMIYLPGQLKEQIKLDHISSHVDLTPTLLELVGVDTSKYFFHGENILNPSLKHRMIFQMNQMLKPENSFIEKGIFYTYNDLSYESYTSVYRQDNIQSKSRDYGRTENTKKIIKNAKECFNDAGAYFLQQRKTSK